MLARQVISTLIIWMLNGLRTVSLDNKVRFISPVFIGDTITSKGEIITKREYAKRTEDFGLVDEQVTVTNQRGETVIAFIHVYMVEKKK